MNKKILQMMPRQNKSICLFILGFFPLLLYAQSNDKSDTLVVLTTDTTIYTAPDKEATPPDEADYTDDDDDDDVVVEKKEESYFLQKWMTGNLADSLQLRHLTDSAVNAMRNDGAFWYANAEFEKEKIKENKKSWSSPLIEALFWILIIGGFLVFLVLFLSNSNVKIFRSSKGIKTEEIEEETDNIFAINYQKETDKAIQSGNYRQAIRFMFLNLLRDLSEKDIIKYKQDRTNFDYLLQLHNTAWYDGFFKLARNYEYAWYGHFSVDAEKFNMIRKEFKNFENRIGRI